MVKEGCPIHYSVKAASFFLLSWTFNIFEMQGLITPLTLWSCYLYDNLPPILWKPDICMKSMLPLSLATISRLRLKHTPVTPAWQWSLLWRDQASSWQFSLLQSYSKQTNKQTKRTNKSVKSNINCKNKSGYQALQWEHCKVLVRDLDS